MGHNKRALLAECESSQLRFTEAACNLTPPPIQAFCANGVNAAHGQGAVV